MVTLAQQVAMRRRPPGGAFPIETSPKEWS